MRRLRRDPIGFLGELAEQGDVVPFTIGGRDAVLLCRPADIEQVLITRRASFAKAPIYNRAKALFGEGLFTASDATNAPRRRVAQGGFRHSFLERYGNIMVRAASAARERWHPDETIGLAEEMQGLSLRIVTEALFGADLDRRQIDDVRRTLTQALQSDDALISLLAPVRAIRGVRQRMDTVIEDIVASRLESPDPSGDDLLSLLLAANGADARPDPRQLFDDIMTLLMAGFDTIGSALTWAWVSSVVHPHTGQKLHAEIDSVLGGQLPTPADMPRLPYTRALFAESLRLQPPAWALARVALEDCELDAMILRRGTLVVMSQYLVHRDPRGFDRPLDFDPDRWLRPTVGKRSPGAYFPFGAGPRSCIGEGFAWMEAVLVLATLAQRWRIEPVMTNPLAFTVRMTLRPADSVPVRLRPRES